MCWSCHMVVSRFCFAEDGTECSKVRVARAARIFVLTRPIKFSMWGVVNVVAVAIMLMNCVPTFFQGPMSFDERKVIEGITLVKQYQGIYHIKEYSGCLPFTWENCCVLRKFWLEILDYLWRRFENFGNFPVGNNKIPFHLHSNRNFGNFFVNGSKQPVTKRPKGNSLNISKSFDV